jgi:hypothetical protein
MRKSRISKYTAFVPKTVRATKNIGKITVKKINYFLKNTANKVRKTSKMLDNKTARIIHSLTKRRSRK